VRTGIIATAGCATPRLRSWLHESRILRRSAAWAIGSFGCRRQSEPGPDHVRSGRERWLPELVVPWLPGYEKSRRSGLATMHLGNCSSTCSRGPRCHVPDAQGGMEPPEAANLAAGCIGVSGDCWRQPDEGIWEVRGGPQHFVHSKSWLGSHSIARRTSWNLEHSTSQGSGGARSPTKSTLKFVSAVSTGA